MKQKRIKVRLTKDSPYSVYGYYEKGDIGYIDGYVNDNAVIILENGKFAKADLRWIEVVNEEDKNTNTELRESEDERIRKALIDYFRWNPNSQLLNEFTNREVFAWLEKQGEQKPAWSEDDEDYYDAIIAKLEVTQEDAALTDNQLNFLKSLKGKIQLKQEWSEEDENRINRLIAYFEDRESFTAEDDIIYANYLKSLKERYTWKPSGEQMTALRRMKAAIAGEGEIYMPLNSLYEDLKKLREE